MLQTGDWAPLSGVKEGSVACEQEPSIWLPEQVEVDVDDACEVDVDDTCEVEVGPPKAVTPRSDRTDAGTVYTSIPDVAVASGNVILSYSVSRPAEDTDDSALGIEDLVEVDTLVVSLHLFGSQKPE